MKYIIYIVIIVSSILCLSCDKPEELTPKTSNCDNKFPYSYRNDSNCRGPRRSTSTVGMSTTKQLTNKTD